MPTTKSRAPHLHFTDAEKIRTLRLQLRLNQAAFWRPVGVTQSGGSRYESGRDMPKSVILLLELAYGTPKQVETTLAWLRQAQGMR